MIILQISWTGIILFCQWWLLCVAIGIFEFILAAIINRKKCRKGNFNYEDHFAVFGFGYTIAANGFHWEIVIGRVGKRNAVNK